MNEGLEGIGESVELPHCELVYWSDVMYEKPLDSRETNKESPYFLEERYVKSSPDFISENHDTRKKIVNYLARQINKIFLNDDLSLNYGFISDAIINTYFRDLEVYYTENCTLENAAICKVKDEIRDRLCQVLEKHRHDEIMLLSHSMGSIVAFDVLTFLVPQIKIHTFVTMGSPLGLPIVVSKIAAEQKHILNGKKHMITPPGVVKQWVNFSDIMDKVAFNYELSANFFENKRGIRPQDVLVTNDYEIDGIRNPHKSFGYLRAKEFSELLYMFIISKEMTTGQKILKNTIKIIKRTASKFKEVLKEE